MTTHIVILSAHRNRDGAAIQTLQFESFGHAQKFAKDVERVTASVDFCGPALYACVIPADGLTR